MRETFMLFAGVVALAVSAYATEFNVATNGNDANPGTFAAPFRTIQHAADVAQPGDVITVHQGVYRERIDSPRGGTSATNRITYQAAPGEKVTITGSEIAKNWERVTNDTWKVTIPNKYFGSFNPYCDVVHGDWCQNPGGYHTGAVYLNGDWLIETMVLDNVLKPPGKTPLWFARVDGVATGNYLLNIENFAVGNRRIAAATFSAKSGELSPAACSEGGNCVGYILAGSWLKFDKMDFDGASNVEFRVASVLGGGDIELHLDGPAGELIGDCSVADTGGWQKWQTFSAKIKPVGGEKTLCLVFKPYHAGTDNTTIWAQFPGGINPNNEATVEINVRKTVFTPSKTGINYITVRGFDLRDAACNWVAPTAGQTGLITAYWNKGWIIEDNEISHSTCCGIALGKYSDEWDGKRGSAAGYNLTIADAIHKAGWSKANIGGHLVRNNRIHDCEQTGIVGSLGCAFSRIEGNDIHDIHRQGLWTGAETAGIKFHGAIDVVINGNHIYRCAPSGGIWLDWMAQGTQITANLFHDNQGVDIFTEVDHGPFLVANNLLLSQGAYQGNSQGGAFVHNLIAGSITVLPAGGETPFLKAHSTELAGMHGYTVGDMRWYNNLLIDRPSLGVYNGAVWLVAASGNVFARGATPSKFDQNALVKPGFDAGMKLTQKDGGWYLSLREDAGWKDAARRDLVTTKLLDKAKIPDQAFENPDGSPVRINTDYFGKKRDTASPFPGPFEITKSGTQTFKVWPKS